MKGRFWRAGSSRRLPSLSEGAATASYSFEPANSDQVPSCAAACLPDERRAGFRESFRAVERLLSWRSVRGSRLLSGSRLLLACPLSCQPRSADWAISCRNLSTFAPAHCRASSPNTSRDVTSSCGRCRASSLQPETGRCRAASTSAPSVLHGPQNRYARARPAAGCQRLPSSVTGLSVRSPMR